MRQRDDRRNHRTAILILLALLLWDDGWSAFAYHYQDERIVSDTSLTLRHNEWQIGVWRTDYGITDWWMVGTYHVPWVIVAPNLQTKLKFLSGESWAVAFQPGILYLDTTIVLSDTATAKVFMVPLQLSGTVDVAPDWSATLATVFTGVWGSGTYDKDEFEGGAAITNFQIAGNIEWRIDSVWALVLEGRYLAYQENDAAGVAIKQPTDTLTLEVHGAADATVVDLQHAFSVALSAVASFETFNVRFGAGYGNYNIPGMNLVWPNKLPFPEVDVFWRF